MEVALSPTHTAVRYRSAHARGIAPLADIYLPEQPARASVVLVHGGAFLFGSRSMTPMRFLASRLHAAGIAVCAIDYRLVFRGGGLAAGTADVADAVAFWRARHPGRVTLVGLSAGATLSLRAAALGARVDALVCCFGPYGLTPVHAQPRVPTLLLHGDADRLVSVAHAQRIARHREQAQLPTRLVVYPGTGHAFFSRPCAARELGVREIVDHVVGSELANDGEAGRVLDAGGR